MPPLGSLTPPTPPVKVVSMVVEGEKQVKPSAAVAVPPDKVRGGVGSGDQRAVPRSMSKWTLPYRAGGSSSPLRLR